MRVPETVVGTVAGIATGAGLMGIVSMWFSQELLRGEAVSEDTLDRIQEFGFASQIVLAVGIVIFLMQWTRILNRIQR